MDYVGFGKLKFRFRNYIISNKMTDPTYAVKLEKINTSMGEICVIVTPKNKYYKVVDIGNRLEYSKASDLCKIINRGGLNMVEIYVPTDGGIQSCNFITEDVLKVVLSRSQQPKVVNLCEELGFPVCVIKIPEKVRDEIETIGAILKTLNGIYKEMHTQYKVLKYRIDLYIKDKNIVVECDENDHRKYDQVKDAERTKIINEILGNPKWIRYNPKDDIFKVINSIMRA